jgi:hypothetical protein
MEKQASSPQQSLQRVLVGCSLILKVGLVLLGRDLRARESLERDRELRAFEIECWKNYENKRVTKVVIDLAPLNGVRIESILNKLSRSQRLACAIF